MVRHKSGPARKREHSYRREKETWDQRCENERMNVREQQATERFAEQDHMGTVRSPFPTNNAHGEESMYIGINRLHQTRENKRMYKLSNADAANFRQTRGTRFSSWERHLATPYLSTQHRVSPHHRCKPNQNEAVFKGTHHAQITFRLLVYFFLSL